MGDFNWVSPQFLAFASPQSNITSPIPPTSPEYSELPTCIPEIATADISGPFKNILAHFVTRNIGLVIRLNSPLYCPSYFTALGMTHLDMIFDDGTCPPLPLVQKFIRLAQDTINRKRGLPSTARLAWDGQGASSAPSSSIAMDSQPMRSSHSCAS